MTFQPSGSARRRPSREDGGLIRIKVPVAGSHGAGVAHGNAGGGRGLPDPQAWDQAERSGGLGQNPQRNADLGQVALSQHLSSLSSADHRTGIKNACDDPDVQSYSRKRGIQCGPSLNELNVGSYTTKPKPHRKHMSADVMAYQGAPFDQLFATLLLDIKEYPAELARDRQLAPYPTRIKLISSNLNWLKEALPRVKALSHKISGLVDILDDLKVRGPITDLHTRPFVAARYGLTTEGIDDVVGNAFLGPVSALVGHDKRGVDIHMRADPARVDRLSKSEALPHRTPAGAIIRPEQVDIVSARLQGVDFGIAMSGAKAVLSQDSALSPGAVEYGGQYAFQQVSFGRLLVVLLVAILLVLTVLVVEFCSFYDPLASVIGAVPTLLGSMLGLWTGASPST